MKNNIFRCLVFTFLTYLLLLNSEITFAHGNETAQAYPVFEMRTYTTFDGKLKDLHTRFENHTTTLFEKHGMKNIAYWVPDDKPNTLIYIIAHQSKDAAIASWKVFVSDEEWKKVYADSIARGKLVKNIDSVFMTATKYSNIQ